MITVVELKKNALEEIIRSAYEDYNRETFGNVFGYSYERGNRFIYVVEQTHRVTSAENKPTEIIVDVDSGAYRRASWSSQNFLGAFHSHTSYWNNEKHEKGKLNLSERDLKLMRGEEWDIFLTVAINKVMKKIPITVNLFYFSGSFSDYGEKYHVKLGAYYFNKRVRRAIINVRKKDLREIFK